MKYQDLSGMWSASVAGLEPAFAKLPGTLDENAIGFPDTGSNQWHPDDCHGDNSELMGAAVIQTRLTRNHTYEGPAYFTRSVAAEVGDRRVFVEAERSRKLTLEVNGKPVPPYIQGTVSTPYVFEATDFLIPGDNKFTFCCDNSYPGWPHDAIVFSSAATDETQTNWNGIIGYLRLRYEKPSFISDIRAYPRAESVDVQVELDCREPYAGVLKLTCPAFAQAAEKEVSLPAGRGTVEVKGLPLAPNAARWDEECGVLHELAASGDGLEPLSIRFGLRVIGNNAGKLALNGRNIFLRSEANCCVFPETGHMPTSVEGWKEVLEVFRSYGVNCMRFHSHCPPGAAFAAADELGMLMQPELSHWNPKTAFEDENSWDYYRLELREILRAYANHPSFIMLTLGNELNSGALGYKRMNMLTQWAKGVDPTRLYSNGSNNFHTSYLGHHLGPDPDSDFFTSSNYYSIMLRATSSLMVGYLNEKYPDAKTNFDEVFREARDEFAGPMYGFEVGQYEVLPDFDEWEGHAGVTRPDNYMYIRDKVEKQKLLPEWKRRVEATGELSLISYREEVEAMLRTRESSGISLLGLQDFPGQGTALVGMLNAHLKPKPYAFARPERFRRFFSGKVPLVLLEKYTYNTSETLTAGVKLANYSRENINGSCIVRLMDGGRLLLEQALPARAYPRGVLTFAGTISFPLSALPAPCRLTLTAEIGGAENDYPVWVYPAQPVSVPAGVLMTSSPTEAATALEAGRDVFLSPRATEEHFPNSIQAQFSTDFWSVGTFAKQSGFMGCMMEPGHPVFAGFPTEFHSNWQWWPMCRGRAMILPKTLTPLVTGLDCYARMRHMGLLFEAKVGNGRLVLSSMGLNECAQYPEVRALTQSILDYMASGAFKPKTDLPAETLREIVK